MADGEAEQHGYFPLPYFCQLPLFLNAEMVANVLGVSSTICYEMMHAGKLPVLRIGSRLIVPKEKFLEWIEKNTSGGTA